MRSLTFAAGVLLGLLLAIGLSSRAQMSVSVFGLSKHSESGYCEVNPGLGVNYQASKDLRFGAGRYLNSKCRWSDVLGVSYTPVHYGNFSFGAALLRLTGYRDQPVIAPLPIGSYHLTEKSYIDFFVVKNRDLMVTGGAWRYQW
jgi:hypothetical protein